MSRQIALDNICLKKPERWAHTEYSLTYHEDYIRAKTGMEPGTREAHARINDLWQIDFNWCTNDGLYSDWANRGRCTNMGHAEYASDGSDKVDLEICPFQTMEDVWSFDAVKEYGLPDKAEQVQAYQNLIDRSRERNPDQLTTGGYYKTLVSGAIQAFGWDMFLMALSEPEIMESVFDSFYRRTKFHMDCWAETDVEVVIQHDDFVWSEGAFMNPEIYRKIIIPFYAELWKPLRAAGKKVLFCSDANFMDFAEDVAAAGNDGFIFEPMTDFGFMVERFGSSHCLVGSCVDCRDLTLSHWDTVEKQIDRTFQLLSKCKGAIVATGNHLPANIPPEMMDRYIQAIKSRL
jgi:hypothetical protein